MFWHGKSPGIHQREQKNNPWHSRSQVIWFIYGLSNHKSSSTNRLEENCKYRKPQHMLRWIRGRYPVTYLIQDTRQQAWRTFEVHGEYILHVLAPNTLIIWGPIVHVLASEQLADDGFYRKNTASGVIEEIVLADAFYAFVLEWSFGLLNQLDIAV